jgi:hypothetical protein
MGQKNAYRLLVGRPEGKSQLGRPSHKWVDFGEIVCRVLNGLVWLRIGTSGELL